MRRRQAKRPHMELIRGGGAKSDKPAQRRPRNPDDWGNEKRGVVEVMLRYKDWRGFEVWNSDGVCLEYVEWPLARATQARIDSLWFTLDAEDPITKLKPLA